MKVITKIFISVVGIYSSQLLAAPEWEQKNYSGGAYVCHKQTLFKSKWWAGSYNEPDPNGPTVSNQQGWGTHPWLPILDSNECISGHSNKAPLAIAGDDFHVLSSFKEEVVVTLDGSASYDPDGDSLKYRWRQTSGPTIKFNSGQYWKKATFNLPVLSKDTEFRFSLTVNDGVDSSVDEVIVLGLKGESENHAPVADAGPSQTIQSPNDRVILDGSMSTDADMDRLTYLWQQKSGPSVTIQDAYLAQAQFVLPELTNDTEFVFQLTVSDGQEAATDITSVQGKAVLPPKLPGSIIIDIDTSNSGLKPSDKYQLVLVSQLSGERFSYQLNAENGLTLDNLNLGEYQVWVEFEGNYQPVALPKVITLSNDQPYELSFAVKPSVDLDQLSIIDGLKINTVVDGLFQARQMAWGDGYLFIGSSAISEENNARGNKIYAIPYDYVSGKAGEPIVVADNLLEPHGVAYRNGTLYFSTSMYVFRIENVITKLGKSIEAEQVLTLPAGDANFPLYPDPVGLYWHQKHTLKFNSFDSNDDNLYISIGSPCNICVIKEEPKYGSILKVDTDTFETVQLAQGIRNTVGFDWDPVLGDLWFTDNNPQNTDGHTTYFPGEINKISAQHLSSGVMPHFGFPYVSGKDTISITPEQENGTAKHTGGYDYIPEGAVYSDILIKDIKPENYQKPEFELEARTAPLGLVFWQPTNAPSHNGERSFVYTTHGPGDGERTGYEVRMLTLSKEGKPLFDRALITGWKQPQGISGKPVELLVMPDNSLLISDDAGNTIYRLEYSPTFSGQINLFPSQGEMDDSEEMVQATLRDSSGTSRRLYMSLSQSGYTIDNLELGDYTLTVPDHGDMKPSQSTISFSLSEHDSIARIDWSYGKDDGNEGNKEGMLSIDSPLQPSNAPSSILLALKSDQSEEIYIDSDWATHTEKWVNVGNYTVDFPYTSTAIPTPQRQDIVVSDKGASVSWGYVEYDTDKAYFDAVVDMSCGACHTGQFAPDLTQGPSNQMIENYRNNPDAIAEKIQYMVEWRNIACDSVCQETLAKYLEDDLWSDALPNEPQSDIHGRRQLRLMTRQEYANTVRDLFNIDVPLQMLPADDREAEGSLYGNPGKFGYLTSDKMNAYLNTAVYVEENLDIYALSQCEEGAGEIPEWDPTETYTEQSGNVVHEGNVYKAKYWSKNSPPAQNNAQYGQPWQFVKKYIAADANCLTNWYARILERMIRRPLADEDRLLYPAQDITKQLASLLISPQFLYRREAGVLNQEGRYSLTAHELATLVSYTLVGSLPDVQLWSKANDGSLLTSDVLEQQIDRLLTEPQAYEHFATFMMQTLEFDEERVVVERDGLSKEVGQAMVEEFKAYIRATVFDEELGRFSDLLSHNKTFVNQTLAQHYGLSGNFGSSFSEALIPQNRGTGLLSLGAIAVAYSTDHKTRVIPRGRMVQHSLLGWEQSLPSGKAPDDIKQDTSTKDFWTKATGPSTECWMCHEKMNDIGFAFDVLDKSGRYRAYEDYLSLEGEQYPNVLLQTHGTLVDVDGQDSSFDDLRGLSIYLANSQEARTAFVKNYLSYTLGEASSRFSPLYPEYASFEQFKGLMKTILLSTVVYEREG